VLTRRDNTYVALEQRPEIANRVAADLFFSIHANAAGSATVGGLETYFLNFANNPRQKRLRRARTLVPRERCAACRTSSRDFARMAQASMSDRLRKVNRNLKNLGVKQATVVVLIGATMPGILAEVSFLTNPTEGSLLRTQNYRQQLAEALFAGVMKYSESLKKTPRVATQ